MILFKNSYLMQPVGNKDSSILNDEPFRQFCFVTFQVATHSKPDVIIPVHEVKQEVLRWAKTHVLKHPFFEVMIQEMITDREFESLSRVSHLTPAAPSQQSRVFRKPQPRRRNRHAELPHAGKLCLRPGTVEQEARHQHISLTS